MTNTLAPPDAEAALTSYGSKTMAVEPGGVELIPAEARHGKASQLFWTWTSPNMEFATIGVGIISVLYFGLSFWQAVAAIVVGTGLGAISMGVLSTWGPQAGLPQMVLSRLGFGFLGNILPAGLNAVIAGIGWFAVNSISGALALAALTSLPSWLCLLIVVAAMMAIAFAGHNLVHAFERFAFPVLAVLFVVGAIVVFSKADPGMAGSGGPGGSVGGFLLAVGATFGYAAGWNPYASDYTRYLPADTPKRPVGLAAGLGLFISCVFLESAGAAMVSAVISGGGDPAVDPGVYTELMPGWLGKLTLLAIALGAVCANALNVYSGSLSFMTLGIKLPTALARAAVAAAFCILGFVLAVPALDDAGHAYEAFLLVIAYWIGPWLGVVFTDRLLRRRTPEQVFLLVANTRLQNWAGPIAMALGMVISIWLFANQEKYVGPVVDAVPQLGDITFFVGFVISAVVYAALSPVMVPKVPAQEPAVA